MKRTAPGWALLVAALLAAPPALAKDEKKAKPRIPPPPAPWLAKYAEGPTDEAAFRELRETLFRTKSDADLVRGLAWLVHAPQKEVRVKAARGLAEAYLLGAHLGADPVPGIRAFARDPDAFVRTYLLSALSMYDSPLARELVYKHHTGEIPVPDNTDGEKILEEVRQDFMPRFATPKELEVLKRDGRAAQAKWFAAAPERPATATEYRFETVDIHMGSAHKYEPKIATGVFVWADSLHTVYGTDGWVGSGDSFFLNMTTARGGLAASAGAQVYNGGISGIGGVTLIDRARYLGDRRVRVWIRHAGDAALEFVKRRYEEAWKQRKAAK